MISLLEERYRRALRLLPAGYRRQWEEDMVAAYLQAAYASDPADPEAVELGSPSLAELASIGWLAIRLRLGAAGSTARAFMWGEAVRKVALTGLLIQAVAALVGVTFTVWAAQGLPGLTIPSTAMSGSSPAREGLSALASLMWLPAFLALLFNHRRAAWWLSAAAFTPILASTIIDLAANDGAYALSHTLGLLVSAISVLALAAFHDAAEEPKPRAWLIALPTATAVTFTVLLLSQSANNQPPAIDWPSLTCAALIVATIIHLGQMWTGKQEPSWTLALALLAAATFALRVATLLDTARFTDPSISSPGVMISGGIQAAAVLVFGLILGIRAARTLNELPSSAEAHRS
jgi:hypothetical protein